MTWLALLKAALLGLSAFASFLKDRQLIEAGQAQSIVSNLKASLDEIARAENARDSVRRSLERDPAGLRDEDGFKRRD